MTTTVNKMYKDASLLYTPDGAALYVLNGVYDDLKGIIGNEDGFYTFSQLVFNTSYVYFINGVLPLDDSKAVISFLRYEEGNQTGNFEGEIGVVNSNGDYSKILGGPFNFNLGKPLKMVFKRNFKREQVIVLTDNYNPPRLINLDNPPVGPGEINADEVVELKLFRNYNVPSIDLDDVISGGGLETGSYEFFTLYEDEFGNRSGVLEISDHVVISDEAKSVGYDQYDGSEGGASTNKLVELTISGLDQRYRFVRVGAIFTKNGVRDYYIFGTFTISGSSLTLSHTGLEEKESISPEEILQRNESFSKVGDLTTSNKVLYLADLERSGRIDFQKYANNIKIDYELEEHSANQVKDNSQYATVGTPLSADSFKSPMNIYYNMTWMPGEVYGAYFYFLLTDGTFSEAFHIPGRPPADITHPINPSETDPNFSNFREDVKVQDIVDGNSPNASALASDHYLRNDLHINSDIQFFRARDTSDNPNSTSKGYSNLAYWENSNEIYPDTEDWEVYGPNGKKNLPDSEKPRNNPVRHHKMPYYGQMLGSTFTSYIDSSNGPKVRTIKLKLRDVYIPQHILNQIQDVRIGFAKRDTQNFTVAGQSILFPSAEYNTSKDIEDLDGFLFSKTRSCPLTFNLVGLFHGSGAIDHEPPGRIRNKSDADEDYYFKMHPFDMMYSKYRVNPGFISLQDSYQLNLDFTKNDANETYDIKAEFSNVQGSTKDYYRSLHIDTTDLSTPDLLMIDLYYHPDLGSSGIKESLTKEARNRVYPVSGNSGYVDNNTPYSDFSNIYSESGYIFKVKMDDALETDHPYRFNLNNGISEDSDYLLIDNPSSSVDIYGSPVFKTFNLHEYRTDIYTPFQDQEIFTASLMNEQEVDESDGVTKSFDVQGGDCYLSDYSFRTTAELTPAEISSLENNNSGFTVGSHPTRVLYTLFCITTNNANLRHEGNEDHEKYYPKLNDGNWSKKTLIERPSFEDNVFIYNSDYTLVNDKNVVIPYDPNTDTRTSFSTMIARSEQDNLEKRYEPWRNFRTEDYYKILDLKYGEIVNIGSIGDRLIINMESATFMTYGQTQMNTNQSEAYIGMGDIFRGRPKEIVPVEVGYAGTQSPYSCLGTEYGYIFYDSEKQILYKVGDGAEELTEKGLRNYFYNNMRLKGAEQINGLISDPKTLRFYDGTFAPGGLGFTCGYDRLHNRVFVTKKDFEIKDEYIFRFKGAVSAEEFDIANYGFFDLVMVDGVLCFINLQIGPTKYLDYVDSNLRALVKIDNSGDKIYDQVANDRSETLSYSFRNNSWISHHSFIPSFYLRNRNQLFSSNNYYEIGESITTNNYSYLFEHNKGSKGIYYDASRGNFELVIPIQGEKLEHILSAIYLNSYCIDLDGSVDRNTTFDEILIHNSYQTSGVVELIDKDSMRNIRQYWYINKFRDLLNESDKLILDDSYEPDSSIISSSKRWYKRKKFIDQYHLIKLRFKNNSDKSLYLHRLDALLKPVRR